MKKLLLFITPLLFLISCSSGGGGDAKPEILGCMDDCALNYNVDATVDDQSCIYSFLGTYSIDVYTIDGSSIFNAAIFPVYCVDAAITFGVGTYGTAYLFSDGSSVEENGTFTNTMTSITLYPSDGSAPSTYQITKINCLEFDGTGVIDGETHYIETNYLAWFPISGCMDDCALNYNPMATVADVCVYSFLGTYTVSEYKADGVSLFSPQWGNHLVSMAITFDVTNGVGYYATYTIMSDGQEFLENGTFVNSETQLIFYPSDGSAAVLWNTTKINCLEFDGNAMSDGMFLELELDYFSGKLDNLERTPTNSKFDVTQFKRKK